MKKLIIIILMITGSSITTAADGPNWNYIGLGYSMLNFDTGDIGESIEPTGLGLDGSVLIGENFFIFGNVSTVDDGLELGNVEFNTESIGVGYRFEASKNADFYVGLSYVNAEVCIDSWFISECVDDNGYGLDVGIRSMISDKLELAGGMQYVDIDGESDTSFSIGAHYYFTPSFAVGVGYSAADDVDGFNISGRFQF